MNDDLVAKKFALYMREADGDGLDELDQFPVMLSSNILTQTVCTTSNKLAAQTQPRPGKHPDVTSCSWQPPLSVCE